MSEASGTKEKGQCSEFETADLNDTAETWLHVSDLNDTT